MPAVQVLRSLGLQPHMLACRSSDPLEGSVRDKLALFCQVPPDSVLGMHDVSNIWQVRGAGTSSHCNISCAQTHFCCRCRWRRSYGRCCGTSSGVQRCAVDLQLQSVSAPSCACATWQET